MKTLIKIKNQLEVLPLIILAVLVLILAFQLVNIFAPMVGAAIMVKLIVGSFLSFVFSAIILWA